MCGIAGVIDNINGVDASDLQRMSDLLAHRGPDDEGFLLIDTDKKCTFCKGKASIAEVSNFTDISTVSEKNKVALLHRRLSILDLSPSGHQPMTYVTNNISITFNGEIYNYSEIKAELLTKGYTFKSDSDTEVILASYLEWGYLCVNKFVGMWAFAIVDSNKNEVFLSRDRFGIKPLYYCLKQGRFAFASEIKALLTLSFVSKKANHKSVIEYISYGTVNDPSGNLFTDIQSLPPAHNAFVDLQSLSFKLEEYYNLDEHVNNYSFNGTDKLKQFGVLFNESVDLHMRSDVPLGSCLSGGLDSSAIVAFVADKVNPKRFKTFTAGYKQANIDESHFANMVNNQFKNIDSFTTFPSIEAYWQDFDKFIWHQDLPVHSTSMYAQWEVMKLVNSQKIKVVLNGQGSDEILGGYYNFAGIHLIELLKKGKLISFSNELRYCNQRFTPSVTNEIGRAFYYFLPEFLQREIRSKKRLGPNFISTDLKSKLVDVEIPERGGKTYKECSVLAIKYGLQSLLRYEDRNSMAFSIESRVPFLDHRLVEFSIALENQWKLNNGWSKYILRKTIESKLPKDVVWRKNKMGFLTPQQEWKNTLKAQLSDYIHQTQLPAVLDKEYVYKMADTDLNSPSHLSEFWKIVSFIKWSEVFRVSF